MEGYKKKLKLRIGLQSAIVIAAFFMVGWSLWCYENASTNSRAGDFFSGFQMGLFSGWVAVMIWRIVIYIKVLCNKEKLDALYIKEYDERTLMIRTEAGANAFWISASCVLAATVVSGFYNYMVFFTLLGVILLMGAAVVGAKIFFSKKL